MLHARHMPELDSYHTTDMNFNPNCGRPTHNLVIIFCLHIAPFSPVERSTGGQTTGLGFLQSIDAPWLWACLSSVQFWTPPSDDGSQH